MPTKFRFSADGVALLGLDADIEQGHARILHPVDGLHVDRAHDRELPEHVRLDLYVSAAVADSYDSSVHGRENGAEGGADDAGEATYAHESSCDEGSGGTGAYEARDRIVVAQHHDGLHHGAVALQPDGVGGLVFAGYDIGGVEYLDALGRVLALGKFGLQDLFVAREDEIEVVEVPKGSDGSVDIGLRAAVASEAVYNYLNHYESFLRYERRRLWMVRSNLFHIFWIM